MTHEMTAAAGPVLVDPPHIRLMALSGPMGDLARARQGLACLQALGFAVDNQAAIDRRWSRFAGTDAERLADLQGWTGTNMPAPDLLLATRGGYGAIRLLDRIDYDVLCPQLRQHGSIVMGYSDTTAVQLALLARGGVLSWSGPMLYGDFAVPQPSAFMLDWLQRVLSHDHFTLSVEQPQLASTRCQGRLWGGNLTVLTSLVGTPYLPAMPGGILFLEDIGEDVYRVERMLQQLRLAGVLTEQSAILLGHFSGQKPDGFDPAGYTMQRLLNELSGQLNIPVCQGLPVGHVADIVPLPIGAEATLSCCPDGFSLTLSGYPALQRLPSAWCPPSTPAGLPE